MGRIRTTWIKTVSKRIKEKRPDKVGVKFEDNKNFLRSLNLFDSKKMRNKVAGYMVKLSKKKKF